MHYMYSKHSLEDHSYKYMYVSQARMQGGFIGFPKPHWSRVITFVIIHVKLTRVSVSFSLVHKNLTQRKGKLRAVYFADFNVFITWPKHFPCVAQFL